MVGPDIYARPLSSPLQPVHLSPKAASLGLLAACLQCIMYGVGMAAHHAEGTDLGREGGTTRHLATPHSDENCQICNRASARDSGRRRALRRQPAECTQRTLDNLGGVELGRHVFCRHQSRRARNHGHVSEITVHKRAAPASPTPSSEPAPLHAAVLHELCSRRQDVQRCSAETAAAAAAEFCSGRTRMCATHDYTATTRTRTHSGALCAARSALAHLTPVEAFARGC